MDADVRSSARTGRQGGAATHAREQSYPAPAASIRHRSRGRIGALRIHQAAFSGIAFRALFQAGARYADVGERVAIHSRKVLGMVGRTAGKKDKGDGG
jgi:hypothetical protein